MKKRLVLLTTLFAFVLCGCGSKKEGSVPVIDLQLEDSNIEETSSEISSQEESDSEEDMDEEASTEIVKVENTGFEYFCEEGRTQSNHKLTLKVISEKENKIVDEEEWFQELGIEVPGFPCSDSQYSYDAYGDNMFDFRYLLINDQNQKGYELDFSDYIYAPEYVEEDKEFVFERVAYAQIADDILYVETAHPTYANSCRQNAYITALDMKDFHTIWKTQPLTANAYNFVIYDDFIIAGYGFTEEPDAINIIDRNTGKVVNSCPLKTMAEYIVLKDNVLYVRTYNTNYEFELTVEK